MRVTPVQEKYENMQERFKAIMTQMYAEGKSRKFTDKSVIILKGRKYYEI